MAQDTPVRPLSRDLILGSWRMTSWVTRDVATGERQDALGQNPRGTVVYTPQRVTFLITKNNRARPERLPPSDEEKIALFDTMFAYSGAYTVESDRVVHHVDLSWNEAWSGTDHAILQGRRTDADLHFAPCQEPVRRTRGCPRGEIRARVRRAG
jgi:Lipocalin-like domain